MIATKSDQLLANGAAAVGLALALSSVSNHPLHLVATGKSAVSVPTLAGVNKGLDASLDRLLSNAGVGGGSTVAFRSFRVQPKAELLHLVRVAHLLVTIDAEVEVLTHRAVITSLHTLVAGVASVYKLVLALKTLKITFCYFVNVFEVKLSSLT